MRILAIAIYSLLYLRIFISGDVCFADEFLQVAEDVINRREFDVSTSNCRIKLT